MDEMTNVTTEIVDVTVEEIKPAISYKKVGLWTLIGGAAVATVALVGKFVVVPLVHKIKQEKELKEIDEAIEHIYDDEEPIQPEYAPDED